MGRTPGAWQSRRVAPSASGPWTADAVLPDLPSRRQRLRLRDLRRRCAERPDPVPGNGDEGDNEKRRCAPAGGRHQSRRVTYRKSVRSRVRRPRSRGITAAAASRCGSPSRNDPPCAERTRAAHVAWIPSRSICAPANVTSKSASVAATVMLSVDWSGVAARQALPTSERASCRRMRSPRSDGRGAAMSATTRTRATRRGTAGRRRARRRVGGPDGLAAQLRRLQGEQVTRAAEAGGGYGGPRAQTSSTWLSLRSPN